jgi:hypothetical protein
VWRNIALTDRRDVLRYLGLSAVLPFVPDLSGEPTIIPFTLQGRRGKVAVKYGTTEDPVASGYDVVPGMHIDIGVCRGYPTIDGVVESYEGSGYRELCGWIQVITDHRYRTMDESDAAAVTSQSIDKFPSMMDLNIPFVSFGMFPKFFDAPCGNLNDSARLRWTADTFLTTAPLRSRDEEIHRLLGIRWGYTESQDRERHPVSPFPLVVTGPETWNALLPFLKQQFADWRFAQS